MLPRQYRLPATVRLVNPTVYTTHYFTVKFAKNDVPNSRFGFIIGKAASKLATDRNRARRLVRSCIEESLEKITPGYDMLFLLKKGIIDTDKETLSSEIIKLLTSKKLLNDLPNT